RMRLAARVAAQGSDSIQQLHTVSKRRDAKLLPVLVREARDIRLVYVILAEDRLVLAEAQASQPDHDVHDGAPYSRFNGHDGPAPRECLAGQNTTGLANRVARHLI